MPQESTPPGITEATVGKHDKPAPPQPPNDPPGSGDGVPGEIIAPGGGDRKK